MENKRPIIIFSVLALLVISVLIGTGIYLALFWDFDKDNGGDTKQSAENFSQFKSEQELKDYLDDIRAGYNTGFGDVSSEGAGSSTSGLPNAGFEESFDKGFSNNSLRVSETYVQVEGIDEPDILKTDGKSIFYSGKEPYYYFDDPEPIIRFEELSEPTEENSSAPSSNIVIEPDYKPTASTKLITAFPVDKLGLSSEIDMTGDLLLFEDVLIIMPSEKVYAFDVSDSSNPNKLWEFDLDEKTRIDDARLYKDELYLFTNSYLRYDQPCPVDVIKTSDSTITINCNDIFYPGLRSQVDNISSVFKIDINTGSVEQELSYLASQGNTVVYMSGENIFISYEEYVNYLDIVFEFIVEDASDLFPSNIVDKLKDLNSFDISSEAKTVEMGSIIENYMNSLEEEEQRNLENELDKRMDIYIEKRVRELQTSQIIKISSQELDFEAAGNVPGRLLNQFAMDDYEGNLRVATSTSNRLSLGGEDFNDLYVLDKNLDEIGSIKDFGLDESIYAVRFVQDKAFVVTFKQTDPFYIMDLSDPSKPEIKGELKIPGYSTLLHPISDDLVLGIGEEDFGVKVSLFDVSDKSNPVEIDKYQLKYEWSEVNGNHHAFLLDDENKIFFIPGSTDGYIFSYENNNISLKKLVKNINAKRALYIDNYFYVVGSEGVKVFNQSDWNLEEELSF